MPAVTNLPERIGRYQVERLLGRGAMGLVCRAHDPDIDRPVAIKLILADLLAGEDRDAWVARFRREAKAAGRCMHPNIVAVYDVSVHEGNPFLVLEYVEGASLRDALDQGRRVSPGKAIAIMGQVLDALACAHG
ncbi:MAG: serine/threonine protein kinase, partial [Acetobacteraceae bacterium]|nr:serine/threonine protein kinase [Acetobacteraceae bacterium]